MKTAAVYRSECASRPNLPYPNAATRREIFHKFLDLLLMGAIGVGAATVILFLLAIA